MIVAFASGLLFAVGLAVSGMTLPANILAFLDVTGSWDPSLALVMGSGLAVLAVMRLLAPKRPLLAASFAEPAARGIDTRLVTGAAIFGIGWGLGGFCPGPGIVAFGAGCPAALLFVAAMAVGMVAHSLFERVVPESQPAFEVTSEVKPETCG
ncbi:MAG: hypothetical protein JST54_00860 [Deltaproteobacteria bacterium]|nr:hypothetical protein [Deltaproteobacteria bacterium]